ncbi:glycosyltransferase [Actinokineospora sp. NBRC 105648]|uniref:glycosyltransferase n=1 Tax=Actinokineospora sp. NBRC 105648 TaxID=3032206 RepID=UPI0024A14C13|nr:glycosyltransferase [Actinokineospora sp. NBRC 105648]GLZ40430.1 glycosyl transferase [Actinokineospora sp. NBRC 105648]
MSRFLVVVPPLMGHVAPLLGVVAALRARGHAVEWVGGGQWVPADHVVHPCDLSGIPPRPPGLRGAAALKFLVQDYLVPLADVMAPVVADAVQRARPDVVIADQQAYAGAVVARRHGVPWVTSASTSAELVDPYSPVIADWVERVLVEACGFDPRFSPSLILVFSTRALTGEVTRPVRFVGPAIADRGDRAWHPPWPGPAPRVLVTLGTANVDVGGRFLAASLAALAASRWQAVLVDPVGTLGPAPPNVEVVRRAPQLSVLSQVDAVVCHGGHNTVCEALWHGLPLVVAPIRDDQQVIAQQVVTAGAGVRLRFTRATPATITEAVSTVLTKPSFRAAARRIRAEFHAAGGASAAADHLEHLAATAPQSVSPR